MRVFCTLVILLVSFFSTPAWSTRTVRLATTEWPPYTGKELPGMGYIYAVVTQAFQQQGYRTAVEFLPWSEAIQLNKYHNDAFFPAYEDDFSDQYACSEPFHGGPVGLYKRKNSMIRYTVSDPHLNQETALRGLKGFKFGVVEGYSNTETFDNASYLKKIPAKNDFDNLKNLQTGKSDLAFSDVFVAEYLIDEHAPDLDNITFMGPSLENKKLYVCFSKHNRDYPIKLAAFNEGLSALRSSGKLKEIVDEFSF